MRRPDHRGAHRSTPPTAARARSSSAGSAGSMTCRRPRSYRRQPARRRSRLPRRAGRRQRRDVPAAPHYAALARRYGSRASGESLLVPCPGTCQASPGLCRGRLDHRSNDRRIPPSRDTPPGRLASGLPEGVATGWQRRRRLPARSRAHARGVLAKTNSRTEKPGLGLAS
jgi:hypothetical protein